MLAYMFKFIDKLKKQLTLTALLLVIYAHTIGPLIVSNVEALIVSRGWDQFLVEGYPWLSYLATTSVHYLLLSVNAATTFLSSDIFIGFTIGALLFVFWDFLGMIPIRLLGKRRRAALFVRRCETLARRILEEFLHLQAAAIDTSTSYRPDLPLAAQNAIFERETAANLERSRQALLRTEARYGGDTEALLAEAMQYGLSIDPIIRMQRVNAFSWRETAQALYGAAAEIAGRYNLPLEMQADELDLARISK